MRPQSAFANRQESRSFRTGCAGSGGTVFSSDFWERRKPYHLACFGIIPFGKKELRLLAAAPRTGPR